MFSALDAVGLCAASGAWPRLGTLGGAGLNDVP
jgi:hypothetical protein